MKNMKMKVLAFIVVIVSIVDVTNAGRYPSSRSSQRQDFEPDGYQDPYYSSTPSCDGVTKPQLPSYIPPQPIDPQRMLGRWYQYLLYNGYNPLININTINYNIVEYFNALSDTTLDPASNTPSLLVEDLGSLITYGTQACSPRGSLIHLTAKGQMTAFDYDADADTRSAFIGVSSSLVLATDYGSYSVVYECDRYSNSSRDLCEEPVLFVYIRDRPDTVSAGLVTKIAKVVNRIMGPYCFDVSMMFTRKWYAQLGECPTFRPKSDCYAKMLNALNTLAG